MKTNESTSQEMNKPDSSGVQLSFEMVNEESKARMLNQKLKRTLLEDAALYERKTLIDIEQHLAKMQNREIKCRNDPFEGNALTSADYLDRFITPILMSGLKFLIVNRPEEPVNALVAFLMKHKMKFHIPRRTIELPEIKDISEEDSIFTEEDELMIKQRESSKVLLREFDDLSLRNAELEKFLEPNEKETRDVRIKM